MAIQNVLVTGATGLVGAHVVARLLQQGFKVRAVVRSKTKAQKLMDQHQEYRDKLDFHYIDDLTSPNAFDGALTGIDGVVHLASPLNYQVSDNEKELILPAIQGVRSILQASKTTSVQRIVMTSSFGAVLDMDRDMETPYTFSSTDWNPITYSQAADPAATPQDAYRGSKVFAEQAAWDFVKKETPQFDLVTLCPSMIFGPVSGKLASADELNESNKMLWKVATGGPSSQLPPARFNFWIDVRDLAEIHIQALVSPQAGGKRYIPVSPEKFNYQLISEAMREVPGWPKESVATGEQDIKQHIDVDGREMEADFPSIQYHTLKQTVDDFMTQVAAI